jgi:hypothetical protein
MSDCRNIGVNGDRVVGFLVVASNVMEKSGILGTSTDRGLRPSFSDPSRILHRAVPTLFVLRLTISSYFCRQLERQTSGFFPAQDAVTVQS